MPKKINSTSSYDEIILQGVRTHNLKDIDITLPKNKIITITGVSGSGKSSLAFDTIYKEGQFRYIESLSSYLRQFFNLGTRPDLDYSAGLSPAIAIEQNKRIGNSRSTVGTLTELDDYLRLLMAKVGEVYCYQCRNPIRPKTTTQIIDDIQAKFIDQKVYLVHEVGVFEDSNKLVKFVRKNRKQVDQGAGVTRYLVALEWDSNTNSYDELVEYFYLEDPNIPDHLLPVKVYGIFDRVTINNSTLHRLKDDAIKMLGRADKFGVLPVDSSDKEHLSETTSSDDQLRVVLMHGKEKSPDDIWYPWLHQTLDERGISCVIPELPNPSDPDFRERIGALSDCKPDEQTVLIGHARGGMAILRWLETRRTKKVKRVILIGTNRGDVKKEDSGFYTDDGFDYEKIKQHCEEFVVIHSQDDEWVPFAAAKYNAKQLDALKWLTNGYNHFGKGLLAFPQLLSFIDKRFGEEELTPKSADLGPLDQITWYTDKYYCAACNISYPEFTSQHFSANRQDGACQKCQGLGEVLQVDFDKVLDPFSPYLEAILPRRDSKLGQAILKKLAYKYQVDQLESRKDLPEWYREVVVHGDDELLRINTGGGKYVSLYYKGVEDVLTSQYQKGILTVDFQAMLDMRVCPECDGAKLRRESLNVFLIPGDKPQGELVCSDQIEDKYNIFDLQSMPIEQLSAVMSDFELSNHAPQALVERILLPLLDRANTISSLGLGYIHTARQIDSLSGGEIQRMRLAKQLGNRLTGIIYVLDEPTIGLDEREIYKVIEAIKLLQEMGNTIIVVEHNELFIKASDRVVEIGPGAGDFGGKLIFNGPYENFLKQESMTANYLTGKEKVTANFAHTPSKAELTIKNASKHNLKGVDVKIRLGSFTIITGPSGAGKTTLMYHTLYNFLHEKQKYIQSHIRLQLLKDGLSRKEIIQAPIMKRKKYDDLEKLAIQDYYDHISVERITGHEEVDNTLYVDQSSIGKTPRSCPATFIGVFDDIRKLYAGTTEAKMLAFKTGHFSFNSSKGACPECKGYGDKKIELQFLPDTYVPCTLCKGRRYKPEILDIKRHSKNVSEILDMYVMDALEFFEDMTFIADKLQLMVEIGLGYLKMGQPAHTLSGGESQRIKLVKHLLKQYKGHTVYFLDEPTVGLHPSDIEKLLVVLKKFLDNGDTILMIEHEKHLLKFADKVIRLEDGVLA